MKGNKGQALVEFVLILPVFLLMIISMIDFGNIMLKKYSLENDLDTVYKMYNDNNVDALSSYIKDKDIRVNYDRNDDFITINVYKNITIISPVLSVIMGNPYEINVSGVYYE